MLKGDGSEKRYEKKTGEERVWQVFVYVREIEIKRIGGRVREREREEKINHVKRERESERQRHWR